jgi:hypothetical protein
MSGGMKLDNIIFTGRSYDEYVLGFRGPDSSAYVCSMQGPQGHEKTPGGQAPIDSTKIVRMLDLRVTESCGQTEIFKVGRDQYVSPTRNSGSQHTAVFRIIRHRWNRMRIATAIRHGIGGRIGHDTEQIAHTSLSFGGIHFRFLI